ncbi:MAG: site-2 protease family protein [Sulfurovaceae bacterium]|nr:site-2 protease family protein [Sulfurovaceae bacterium]
MNTDFDIIKIIAIALAFIIAIVGHEIMHGYAAYKLGDNTAKALGRLSINPIKHIDPIGSLLVPGVLFAIGAPFIFGWAKPVPINMHTVMQNGGENGAIKVALAGVTFNFLLVAIFSFIYLFLSSPSNIVESFFNIFVAYSIIINAILGFFNLWPIPPLDGSQALKYFAMKHKWYSLVVWTNKLAPYGFFILMAIIATPISNYLFKPIYWLISKILY